MERSTQEADCGVEQHRAQHDGEAEDACSGSVGDFHAGDYKRYMRLREKIIDCGGCWKWNGKGKLSQVRTERGAVMAARWIFSYTYPDKIIKGKNVTAICGTEGCLNPEHLKAMSKKELGKRVAATGVLSTPALCKKRQEIARKIGAKLDEEKVRDIRYGKEDSLYYAKKYGVDKSLIGKVKNGQAWKDYSNPFAGLM